MQKKTKKKTTKSERKKLILSKDTIRTVSDDALYQHVVGAANTACKCKTLSTC